MTVNRVVATWGGPDQPIVLTLYGPAGQAVMVELDARRALTLAQELLACGVNVLIAKDHLDAIARAKMEN